MMSNKYVILITLALAYNAISSVNADVVSSTLKTDIDGKNITDLPDLSTVPPEPHNDTTTVPPTTPTTTTTAKTTTTTNATTTTTVPTTTTSSTTTTPTPKTTTINPNTTTVNPNITTTVAPNSTTTAAPVTTTVGPVTTTEAPHHQRRFDGPSFIGGIVFSCGLTAIGFVAWKFYKARTERNYHTL